MVQQKQPSSIIVPVQPEHLVQIGHLFNQHLGTLVPGWSVSESYIASYLQRNPGEYVVDPWVRQRTTLCALVRQRVVGVAHLLHYASGPEINPDYHNAGEINWFLFWPDAEEAASELLSACHAQFATWRVGAQWAGHAGLPIGPLVGIPENWPHITALLKRGGYMPNPGRVEFIYAGALDQIPAPGKPPVEGMILQRTMGSTNGARFSALIDGLVAGYCEIVTDLTQGGIVSALRGWGEISEVETHENWRRHGIATWLLHHAIAWHRLGGGTRVILSVAEEVIDSAGLLYQKLGWHPIAKQLVGWELSHGIL